MPMVFSEVLMERCATLTPCEPKIVPTCQLNIKNYENLRVSQAKSTDSEALLVFGLVKVIG